MFGLGDSQDISEDGLTMVGGLVFSGLCAGNLARVPASTPSLPQSILPTASDPAHLVLRQNSDSWNYHTPQAAGKPRVGQEGRASLPCSEKHQVPLLLCHVFEDRGQVTSLL